MKTDRRDFIKITGAAGAGIMASGMKPEETGRQNRKPEPFARTRELTEKEHRQLFNMCGYAAPKLDKVRVGFIGLGNRGPVNVDAIAYVDGVEIKALCDRRIVRIDYTQKILAKHGLPPAKEYGGNDDIWKELCKDPDIDLISVAVPRGPLHAKIAVCAMENGKHVAVEAPAASTLEEAWLLVETSERTKKHCMMLENCCYDFFELLTLNMVRQGFFGEIIHADAGYLHHQNNFIKPEGGDMWRVRESQHRNCNLYPSHGIGPICQAMNINRGDRLVMMSSMSSNDFIMGKMAAELAKTDSFYKEFDTNSYRGNMNTSIIRTARGKTIMLQYDITSPRVYSRIHTVSGTKGIYQKYPLPGRIARDKDEWFTEKEMEELTKQYTPEIVKRMGDLAKEIGGHGGMDFLMNWRLIDCLRNGIPLEQDVYDAAAWSSIVPLSEWSVANGSNSIRIPDFTCGSYTNNTPVDITMSKGGNTGVRPLAVNK
jgi:predicted dehydrogenase